MMTARPFLHSDQKEPLAGVASGFERFGVIVIRVDCTTGPSLSMFDQLAATSPITGDDLGSPLPPRRISESSIGNFPLPGGN